MFQRETDEYKTRVDLRAYAATQGYQEDRRHSSGGTTCLHHPAPDDEIFVGLDKKDNHFVFGRPGTMRIKVRLSISSRAGRA